MGRFKDIWRKSVVILDKKQKIRLIGLIAIILFEILLELLGVISVYPFISLVLSPQLIETNSIISFLYTFSGAINNEVFFLYVAIIIILLYFFKNAFNAISNYLRYGFIYLTKKEISVKLFYGYMREPYSFFLEKNSSELMRGITNDVSQYFELVLQCIYIFSDGIMMLTFGAYLIYTDPLLSIMVIIVMVLFVLVFVKQNKRKTTYYGTKAHECAGKTTQWMQQAFGGVKEIKILSRENFFVANFEKYCELSNKMTQKFSFLNTIPHLVLECFCTATILLIISIRVLNGADATLFVPKMAVFAMALFRLFPRVSRVNISINTIIFNYPCMNSVYNDIVVCNEHSIERRNRSIIGLSDGQFAFNKQICVNDVCFKYPNSSASVLNGVNLIIEKGEAIGFVGPSGAGKTTLADIILGVLEPNEGNVLCDNLDIRNHAAEWANILGYIPQAIFLSDDSIRRNVAFGLNEGDIDDEQVWNALDQAQLKEFVEKLPDGINTYIGERGVRLSGGQRQRIGIARALYNKPEILVLDEATSALDTETERAVMESIEYLLGKITMIIIAHRLTTVKNCDVIYKVEDGTARKVKYEELS